MNSKSTGRITGILMLIIFALGVTIFQILQGPTLFSDDFLTATSSNSSEIVLSILLSIFSGILTIIIAILILHIITKHHSSLGFLYIAFCIINFVVISIDNYSIISMLEISKQFLNDDGSNATFLTTLGNVSYQKHWWTHHLALLISCIPSFTLFCILFITKLIPRWLSIFGMLAVTLMCVEMALTIFGGGFGMNMMLPIALAQLLLPIWLIIKGL